MEFITLDFQERNIRNDFYYYKPPLRLLQSLSILEFVTPFSFSRYPPGSKSV